MQMQMMLIEKNMRKSSSSLCKVSFFYLSGGPVHGADLSRHHPLPALYLTGKQTPS